MKTTPAQAPKRQRGRPAVIEGEPVKVTLRLSAADRETLRQLGGAPWMRAQLALARGLKKVLTLDFCACIIEPMQSNKRLHRPGGTGIPDGSNIMNIIKTIREADKIAASLGLVRGVGKYNGEVFWVRPGNPAIITRARLAELAELAGLV